MAAGEHQAQLVIRHHSGVVPFRLFGGVQPSHLLQFGRSHRGAALPIDGLATGHGGEPGAGIARDAVAVPALQRQCERILRALLGHVPVAGPSNQRRDDPTPLVPEGGGNGDLDLSRYISQIGLTSIEPRRAAGIFAATSMASSRSLQSVR